MGRHALQGDQGDQGAKLPQGLPDRPDLPVNPHRRDALLNRAPASARH